MRQMTKQSIPIGRRDNRPLRWTAALLLIALLFSGPARPNADAKKNKLYLNHRSVTLCTGDRVQLKVKGRSRKTGVTWKSGKPKVVSVTKKGLLKAKKTGTAIVTAKVKGKKLKCKVKVVHPPALNRAKVILTGGKTFQLKVKHWSKKVTWKSSRPSVVKVSKTGLLRSVKPGRATVTAKAGGKTLNCDVTIDTPREALLRQYRATVARSTYIVHALGGLDGHTYINSLDGLSKAYASGNRLFEADVSFTSDDRLVLAHSASNNIWTQVDWEERLGQPYDPERPLATFDEFRAFRIQGKYHATTFAELLDFMEKHRDMYVMLDAGTRDYDASRHYYQAVVDTAAGRTDVLDRFITGGHTTDMIRAVRETYDFPLMNLYFSSDSVREKALWTPKQFIRYCEKNGIISFSVSKRVYTEKVATELNKSDLIAYVFTTNDTGEAKALRKRGADVIGSDFLRN